MPDPRFTTLDDWLRWQETLHPRAIDLGLERVRTVLRRLQPEPPPYVVITVGGTNGKGSCVAFLDAMLRVAGYQVGAYTSPHLLRYHERIRVNGAEADDESLCRAFARIDAARGELSLTYFEFGTLAALERFRDAGVEVAVLEVGLGGRLDAVNVVDADAALVVSVDLDHTDWLGADRESIGYEKAGIYRAGRPAICADPDPPRRLLDHARHLGARLYQVGCDYDFVRTGATWRWWSEAARFDDLPIPTLTGDHQMRNAAAGLMALVSLRDRLPVRSSAIRAGLTQARLPGRLQIISGPIEWILDVAHNPHAAAVLAEYLRQRRRPGRTWAIVGLLADKDAGGVIRVMTDVVDDWCAVTLSGPRGRTGAELATLLGSSGVANSAAYENTERACRVILDRARTGDRVVVFGSFHIVAPVLAAQPWSADFSLPRLRET
ncbi:MAG: bifunctional tetrahydrofolate synthase/dihydrofolate synthase [Candidatus Competibacteraceae bacterium]|nr:MAG: bifunctional tetrahydrofolate synthase/dihydrofolate synthase [Candidatus Competibacteraceae bacterium]